jgi:hypothetical protein
LHVLITKSRFVGQQLLGEQPLEPHQLLGSKVPSIMTARHVFLTACSPYSSPPKNAFGQAATAVSGGFAQAAAKPVGFGSVASTTPPSGGFASMAVSVGID